MDDSVLFVKTSLAITKALAKARESYTPSPAWSTSSKAIYSQMLQGIMAAYSTYSSTCAWGL